MEKGKKLNMILARKTTIGGNAKTIKKTTAGLKTAIEKKLAAGKKTTVENKLTAGRKTSVGKKLVKAVLIIAAVNGAIKLISMYTSKKENSKNLPEGEYQYNIMMGGKQLSYQGQKVKKITLSAKMSGIDLNLSNMDDIDGLQIHCKGWMSGICIRVPENIAVKTELKLKASGMSSSVPAYIEENLPTIYISGKMYLSGVDIRLTDRI